MKHRYSPTKLLAAAAILASAAVSQAAPREVYIVGNINEWGYSSWNAPTTDNESLFDTQRLFETQDGSNVYTGTFELSSKSYFRFNTELYDAPDKDAAYFGFSTNVVTPEGSATSQLLDEIATSSVFTGGGKYYPVNTEAGGWVLPTGRDGSYKVILDLNNPDDVKLTLVPADRYYVVRPEQEAPEVATIADYPPVGNPDYIGYFGEDALEFSLYNLCDEKWFNPSASFKMVYGSQGMLLGSQSATRGSFSFVGWPGGILSLMFPSTDVIVYELSADKSTDSIDIGDGSYPDYVDEFLVEVEGYGVTPWRGASAAVMNTVTHLYKQADGTYKNGMALDRPFRFIGDRAPLGNDVYEVIAPDAKGTLREVILPEANGRSSAVCTTSAKGGWWTVPDDLVGTWVEVTLDNSGVMPSITFYAESREPAVATNPIYLVGSIQGWDINSAECSLYPTDNGGYYGSFPVSASDASYMMFRFYTSLGSWGNDAEPPSFGASPYDGDIETVSMGGTGIYSGTGTFGKGMWMIDDWSGETLYAYVNLSTREVIFSNSPIAAAGNLLSGDARDEMWLYNEATGESDKMTKLGDDIFGGYISTRVTDFQFRLFSELPIVASDEADWGTENAYVAVGESTEPDMFGVSEVAVTPSSASTTPDPIAVTLDPETTSWYYVTYDRAAGKVYFEHDTQAHLFLTGAIADDVELTYANRSHWADLVVNRQGDIINIPAGKFDFTAVTTIYPGTTSLVQGTKEVTWDENGMMTIPTDYTQGIYYGVRQFNLKCDDWTGGPIAIMNYCIADLRNLDSIEGVFRTVTDDWNYTSYPAGKLTAQGDNVFKGTLTYADANPTFSMYFNLKEPVYEDNAYYQFGLSSIQHYASYGVGGALYNEGANILVGNDGVYSAPMGFNGYSFTIPGMSGSGELEVTLDLNSMTMTAVNSGTEAPIYEAVADEGSALNGAIITPSTEDADAMTLSTKEVAPADGSDDIEFNFARPDGSVLVPEGGDTEMEFGADGVWSGKLTVASTQRSLTRTAVRTAATASAKWKLTLPEGAESTQLHAVINEGKGTLTVFSSAHNIGAYYISTIDASTYTTSYASLVNIDACSALTRQSSGFYVGEYDHPGGSVMLYFHAIPDGSVSGEGIAVPYSITSLYTFDLTEEDVEVTHLALTSSYAGSWTVNAEAGKVLITFDPANCTLTMTRESASAESVAADDAAQLTLTPGEGCIHVSAPETTVIDVYNLSGALVKRVNAPAGHSTISIAPGFYTAAGAKLLVK